MTSPRSGASKAAARSSQVAGAHAGAPSRAVSKSSTTPTTAAPRFAGKHIHFIGIGGCGMSGLAFMLQQLGAVCGGSDAVGSELTDALTDAGIPVRLEQTSGTIPD